MKKTLALLMALLLVLLTVPAMADVPTLEALFAGTPIDVPFDYDGTHHIDMKYNDSAYDVFFFWEENGKLQYDNSKTAVTSDGTWYFYPYGQGMTEEIWKEKGYRSWVTYLSGDFGKTCVDWYASYIEKDGVPYVRLSMNPWEIGADGQPVEIVLEGDDRFWNKYKEQMEEIIETTDTTGEPTACDHVWYDHNTICVAGIEFRQVRSDLTNKWYNFAAIDLTNDGVQKFDLVASNVFVIGSVTVTKNGDEVVVDWKLNRQGTNDANFILENEFLTIFPDLNAVTEVEPSKFEGVTYAFGQPISIANDLGGDTNVLLYICNQATYCDNLSYAYLNPIYHARYWANLPSRVAQRNAMMELVNADIADMEMTASPMAENVVDSQPTEAYALQTESFWGVDGGWMLNMDGTITWADNDVTAGQYKMQMMVDEAQGSAVSVKAIAGQNIELMYTMFDPVKSGVSIENGVLELMVYVSDTAYLENTWSVFELISGQTSWIGGASLRWYLDANVITQPGWNKVTLKLSDAETLGEAFKPNKLKFFYFAATNVPEDVEFRLANIRLLEE